METNFLQLALLWLSVAAGVFKDVFAQECLPISSTVVYCLDDESTLEVICPSKHWLLLESVEYRTTLDGATCPALDGAAEGCLVTDDVIEVETECHMSEACAVNVEARERITCGTSGQDYLVLTYKCEPRHNMDGNARAISLCDDSPVWWGTLANIDSHPTGLLGSAIYQSPCGCRATIYPGSLLRMRMPYTNMNGCNQNFTVWEEGVHYTFCDREGVFELACLEEEQQPRTLYMAYRTSNITVPAIFVMQIITAFDGAGMEVQCGLAVSEFPSIPSVSYEQMAVAASTEETPTTFVMVTPVVATAQHWKLPLIISMVVLSSLIMIIIFCLVCCRYRHDAQRARNKERIHPNNFTFITEIFVDEAYRSKLVLDPTNRRMYNVE